MFNFNVPWEFQRKMDKQQQQFDDLAHWVNAPGEDLVEAKRDAIRRLNAANGTVASLMDQVKEMQQESNGIPALQRILNGIAEGEQDITAGRWTTWDEAKVMLAKYQMTYPMQDPQIAAKQTRIEELQGALESAHESYSALSAINSSQSRLIMELSEYKQLAKDVDEIRCRGIKEHMAKCDELTTDLAGANIALAMERTERDALLQELVAFRTILSDVQAAVDKTIAESPSTGCDEDEGGCSCRCPQEQIESGECTSCQEISSCGGIN